MTGFARESRLRVLPITIAGAWLVAVLAQATGNAGLLHHHSLLEGGPAPWIAVPLSLVGWLVMIAAMMLPASLPSIAAFKAGVAHLARPRRELAAFLASYTLIWTAFGLLAFLGDVVLHRIVDATPWLAAQPWLVEASILALAGVYQLTPLKRRSLAACRHPAGSAAIGSPGRGGSFRSGLDHGLACLGSSWALMLLMFAEGFGNLWWMVALTAVMVYETTGRDGQRAAVAAGLFLLAFAAVMA